MTTPQSDPPIAIVVAGPNGAGKSTASSALLYGATNLEHYINPDLIARGLNPKDPGSVSFAAGRIVLQRIQQLATQRTSLAFETTLSGRTYVSLLSQLKTRGYHIHLLFLWLKSEDLAVERVAERVRAGGHSIPEDTIRRRYHASPRNFFRLYASLCDSWAFYDNSANSSPVLIAEQIRHGTLNIHSQTMWHDLRSRYGAP